MVVYLLTIMAKVKLPIFLPIHIEFKCTLFKTMRTNLPYTLYCNLVNGPLIKWIQL